jgi:hypothetical protein
VAATFLFGTKPHLWQHHRLHRIEPFIRTKQARTAQHDTTLAAD